MSQGIYSALSGALAQSASLDATANNLANASTAGYRATRPVFQEVLARAGGNGKAPEARFSAIGRATIDTSLGSVKQTGRGLDVALGKDSFIAVQTDAGERYTRAGALEVSPDGYLVTRAGRVPVLDATGEPMLVGTDATIEVGKDGTVYAGIDPVGTLKVVSFERPECLTYEGGALLAAGPDSGAQDVSTEPLEVGYLEESNATPVKAMTELMTATRLFEAMENAISTFREADRQLVATVPK
jgi:flagellar basal-body rod protein FlgF